MLCDSFISSISWHRHSPRKAECSIVWEADKRRCQSLKKVGTRHKKEHTAHSGVQYCVVLVHFLRDMVRLCAEWNSCADWSTYRMVRRKVKSREHHFLQSNHYLNKLLCWNYLSRTDWERKHAASHIENTQCDLAGYYNLVNWQSVLQKTRHYFRVNKYSLRCDILNDKYSERPLVHTTIWMARPRRVSMKAKASAFKRIGFPLAGKSIGIQEDWPSLTRPKIGIERHRPSSRRLLWMPNLTLKFLREKKTSLVVHSNTEHICLVWQARAAPLYTFLAQYCLLLYSWQTSDPQRKLSSPDCERWTCQTQTKRK